MTQRNFDMQGLFSEGLEDADSQEPRDEGTPPTLPKKDAEGGDQLEGEGTTAGEGEEGTQDGAEATTEERFARLEESIQQLLKENQKLRASSRKKEEPKEEPLPEPEFDITDDEYEQALTSKPAFVNLIKKALKTAQSSSTEGLLRKLDGVVDNHVTQKVALRSAIDTFWRANKELLPHKGIIGYIYEELEADNPDSSPIEIIDQMLAKEAYKRLGIKRQTTQGQRKGTGLPAGTTGGRQTQTPPKKNTIADELRAMRKL